MTSMRRNILALLREHAQATSPPTCVSPLAFPASLARHFAAKGDGGVGRRNRTQDLIEMLSPAAREVDRTEEELADAAARAKEYSRQKMKEHRAWQKQFMIKVKLRDAAIEALPTEELRAAARMPDLTPFPSQRQVWVETPPHEQGASTLGNDSKGDARRRKIGTKM